MDLFGFGNKITLETTDHGFCKVTVNREKPLWINKHRLPDAYQLIGKHMRDTKGIISREAVYSILSEEFLVMEDD